MRVCVFLGPTLPLSEARLILDADYQPPAAHGDIYRATQRDPKPFAIALIDGTFRHHAAVRHKEILWALSQGIHVLGAGSMGALRAAELTAFGMTGVGKVFEDFRDGRLEDDDEVAVDHGPAELAYPPLNIAMVDIRASLAQAREQSVIAAATTEQILQIAKAQFYPDRAYAAIIKIYEERYGRSDESIHLQAWLQAHAESQKATDARALLHKLQALTKDSSVQHRPSFALHHTEFWDADLRSASLAVPQLDPGDPPLSYDRLALNRLC